VQFYLKTQYDPFVRLKCKILFCVLVLQLTSPHLAVQPSCIAMSESDSDQDDDMDISLEENTDKKWKRLDVAKRKKKNKQSRFLCIRMNLDSVCKSPEMKMWLQDASVHLGRATTIATRLIACNVLECIEDSNKTVPKISQTFVKRAIDVACNVSAMETKEPDLVRIRKQHWDKFTFEKYQAPDVNFLAGNARQYAAVTIITNCKNHVALNFENRHRLFVTSKIGRWFDGLNYLGENKVADRRRAIRTVECASLAKKLDEKAIEKLVKEKRLQFLACDNKGRKAKKTSDKKKEPKKGRKKKQKKEKKNKKKEKKTPDHVKETKSRKRQRVATSTEGAASRPLSEPEQTPVDEGTAKTGKRKSPEQSSEQEEKPDDASVAWLKVMEATLVQFAMEIRKELGVATHSQLRLKAHFEDYLPYFVKIQKRQEWEREQKDKNPEKFQMTRGFKPMSILPIRSMGAINITIDNSVLRYNHSRMTNLQSKSLGNGATDDQLWRHYTKLANVYRKGWETCMHLVTDGVACTVRLRRKLREGECQKISDRDDHLFRWRTVDEIKKKRVIAVDPGRRDLFTAMEVSLDKDENIVTEQVVKKKNWNEPQEKRKTWKDVVARCSNVEYRELAGFKKMEHTRARIMKADPKLEAFETSMPSHRVSSSEAFVEHLHHFAKGHKDATRLYCGLAHRQEQFDRTRRAQRTIDQLCHRIVELGQSEHEAGLTRATIWRDDVVVAFGNGSFHHASKGYGAGPVKTIKRNLARYCTVIDADEFRTSKQCSNCCEELSDRTEDGQAQLRFGLRCCRNSKCSSSWWNRDVNACRNIGHIFLCRQLGLKVPKCFERGKGCDEEDAETFSAHSVCDEVSRTIPLREG
jgi:hypothetical protein